MEKLFLVALGGAAGAAGRYGLGVATSRWIGSAWPWGTLIANVAGAGLAGLLVGWLAHRGGADQERLRLLLGVGLLGGFTTFSAFSVETMLMIERREILGASAYVATSVAGALVALLAGLAVARRLFA